MKIEPLAIPDVLLITPKVFGDERGFFMETYKQQLFSEAGIDLAFTQDNHSRSGKDILRGLHYQLRHPQGKLVRVVRGEVFDVAVDIRKGSPYFGQWVACVLSAENKQQLYVPPGFAHGFCTLSDEVDFIYKCTDVYHPEDEYGVLWSDPNINIDWPKGQYKLSEKDQQNPILADCNPANLPDYPSS